MRIRETGCDDTIKLSKFKFNCDEVDKSIPDPLPQNLNHFLLIVGKPGSSKTTLLLNMICKRGKMYNKKFDRVYLFSPSLGTIDDCPFEKLPDDQKYEELSEDILDPQVGGLSKRPTCSTWTFSMLESLFIHVVLFYQRGSSGPSGHSTTSPRQGTVPVPPPNIRDFVSAR